MTQPNPTLIFLHIPKAGGSTLYHVLDWNYDHPYTITVYKQIPPPLISSSVSRKNFCHVKKNPSFPSKKRKEYW